MAGQVRTPTKVRRPTIACSPDAEIVYGEWVCPALYRDDESEESPVLSTIDSTFWSESEIKRLSSHPKPSARHEIKTTFEPDVPTENISSMLTILPSFLGCPLPTACFNWYVGVETASNRAAVKEIKDFQKLIACDVSTYLRIYSIQYLHTLANLKFDHGPVMMGFNWTMHFIELSELVNTVCKNFF